MTYINGFYQNAAYASTLIRAFDSFTSTDGGNTWSAPSSGSPTLPPSSYASVPGGDVPLFVKTSTTTYAKTVNDVVNGNGSRNKYWELDGYSSCTNGLFNGTAYLNQPDYISAPFKGYTQGPGYYGKTFFIWPPYLRQHLTTSSNASQIKQFLMDFGDSATDFGTSSSPGSGTYGPPLYGIYNATSTTGSRTWPWPNDGGIGSGTTLSSYLTLKVYIPGGSRKLTNLDTWYQQIMRLYSWDYVIDNLGTTPCDWRVRFFSKSLSHKWHHAAVR